MFHRSPSKDHDNLSNFCSKVYLLLTNINKNQLPYSILIGDSNLKFSKRCSSDKTNVLVLETNTITKSGDCSQVINKPTHFINRTSSCIGLFHSSK